MSHLRGKIKSELIEIRETLNKITAYPAIHRKMKGEKQFAIAFEELILLESRMSAVRKLIELELKNFDD